MKEFGLYYPDGSFQSDNKIKRRLVMDDNLPQFDTPLPQAKGFKYWSDRFRRRQQEYKETFDPQENHIQLSFNHDVMFCLLADHHAGEPTVHYDRIEQEAEMIVNTPNAYVVLVGDLIDGMSWNPGQFGQMEQVPEQYKYMKSYLEFFRDHDRLLIAHAGDHDKWPLRSGIDPYLEFSETYGGHYMEGIGYLTVNVGEQTYKLAGAHRLPGHSMYNRNHPQARALRGAARGADVIYSGHNHQKSHQETYVQGYGNETQTVHLIALGTYKPTDSWLRKQGFAQQQAEEMFGSAIVLHKNHHQITYYDDVLQGCQEFAK